MKKRKILFWCVLAGIVAALVCVLPLPVRVNKTLRGVEWSLDGTESAPAEVRVKGWYLRYLLRDDTFKGDIVLPGVIAEFYDNSNFVIETLDLVLDESASNSALLGYSSIPNYPFESSIIFVSGNFKEVLIAYFDEEQQDGSADRFISLPAENRDEALALLLRMAENDEVWLAQWLRDAGLA